MDFVSAVVLNAHYQNYATYKYIKCRSVYVDTRASLGTYWFLNNRTQWFIPFWTSLREICRPVGARHSFTFLFCNNRIRIRDGLTEHNNFQKTAIERVFWSGLMYSVQVYSAIWNPYYMMIIPVGFPLSRLIGRLRITYSYFISVLLRRSLSGAWPDLIGFLAVFMRIDFYTLLILPNQLLLFVTIRHMVPPRRSYKVREGSKPKPILYDSLQKIIFRFNQDLK